MKIDNDIRGNPLTDKWHVLRVMHTIINQDHMISVDTVTSPVGIGYPTCALLSTFTGKLVINLRNTNGMDMNFAKLVAFLVHQEHHLIHNSCFTGPHESTSHIWCTSLEHPPTVSSQSPWQHVGVKRLIIVQHGNGLANDYITTINPEPWCYDTVIL